MHEACTCTICAGFERKRVNHGTGLDKQADFDLRQAAALDTEAVDMLDENRNIVIGAGRGITSSARAEKDDTLEPFAVQVGQSDAEAMHEGIDRRRHGGTLPSCVKARDSEFCRSNLFLEMRSGAAAYLGARREAAAGTTLLLRTFPEACPFPLKQVEDHGVWPEDIS